MIAKFFGTDFIKVDYEIMGSQTCFTKRLPAKKHFSYFLEIPYFSYTPLSYLTTKSKKQTKKKTKQKKKRKRNTYIYPHLLKARSAKSNNQDTRVLQVISEHFTRVRQTHSL